MSRFNANHLNISHSALHLVRTVVNTWQTFFQPRLAIYWIQIQRILALFVNTPRVPTTPKLSTYRRNITPGET